MTKNVRFITANDAMNITNEKLVIGTQLKASTWIPHDFNIMYTPKTIKPNAIPIDDTANKNWSKEKHLRLIESKAGN